jgi:hypothetical protein
MVEKECYYVKSVGGVHENIPSTSFFHMLLATHVHKSTFSPHVPFSSISNVENVHLSLPNISDVDASQLAVVEPQAVS